MRAPTREEAVTIGLTIAEELPDARVGCYRGLFFTVKRSHPDFQTEATACIQRIAADIINGRAAGNDDLNVLILFDNGVAKRIKIQVSVVP